jgi:hypothetical protein
MRHVHLVALAPAFALAAAALSGCTALNHGAAQQFLERSYIAPYTSSDSTISYEAFVAPHIFFLDQQAAALDRIAHSPRDTSASGSRLILSPMFVIRQLHDSSSAVRTPSFMPRLSYERFRVTRLDAVLVGGSDLMPATPEFNWTRIDGVRFTVAHHSDGQAGCFLEGQTPGHGTFEADDCVGLPDTGKVRINRANGDFSTTYLGAMLHRTYIRAGNGDRPRYSAGASVEYDWHVNAILWGRLPAIERQFYGSWRAHAQVDLSMTDGVGCGDSNRGWCVLRGQWRTTLFYEQAPTRLGPLAARLEERIVPYRYYADATHTFDALGSTGPFVRYVDGPDYYNVGFVHRRRGLLVGWLIDMSGYPPSHAIQP